MNYFHKKDLPMNEEMINFWNKNGYLVIEDFNTEEECNFAKYELFEAYNEKPQPYKDVTLIDAYCVDFKSFPIEGLKSDIKA